MSSTRTTFAVLAALLMAGCGARVVALGDRSDVCASADAPMPFVTLASADGVEPQVVELPRLDAWPVVMASDGPLYAHVELSPLVIQMGVLADANRAEAGAGFSLAFGYKLATLGTTTIALEGQLARSAHHNPTSDVDGTAERQCAALRLTLGNDQKIQPFMVGGVGTYALTFDGLDAKFDLTGAGGFAGGGVDIATKRNLSVRIDGELHLWDAAETGSGNGGGAATLWIGAGLAVSF